LSKTGRTTSANGLSLDFTFCRYYIGIVSILQGSTVPKLCLYRDVHSNFLLSDSFVADKEKSTATFVTPHLLPATFVGEILLLFLIITTRKHVFYNWGWLESAHNHILRSQHLGEKYDRKIWLPVIFGPCTSQGYTIRPLGTPKYFIGNVKEHVWRTLSHIASHISLVVNFFSFRVA